MVSLVLRLGLAGKVSIILCLIAIKSDVGFRE